MFKRMSVSPRCTPTGRPRLYKSDYHDRNVGRLDEKLSDIALATSAAPTYFDAHHLKNAGPIIDGGICANNPSMVALVDAISFDRPSKRGTSPVKNVSEVLMISVGTGEQPEMPYDADKLANAGLIDWAQHITDVMFESQSWIAHSQSRLLLGGDNYLRLNPRLGLAMALDDISHLEELRRSNDIDDMEQAFIKKHFL
jgi:patatin-like phospholipase/acyl hydrolase